MLYHRIEQYILEKKLFTSKDKLLVALSGGADSVALLRILLHMGYQCEAAHCNFHLRGEESDRDELFVRELCAQLSVPVHVVHFDTIAYSKEKKVSIEMAARELRYDWFEKIRLETNCSVIAVAHHKDDSVETILLNLIRGTGINGLCGIRPQNGNIVRPLLVISRAEIISYLHSLKQDYVIDCTNLQDEYTRNKIRLSIIPLMEKINPSVQDSIINMSQILSDINVVYTQEITDRINYIVDEHGIRINALLSHSAPKALLFEVLRPLNFNSDQIDDIYNSLNTQSGKQFYSKTTRVVRDRDYLLIEERKPAIDQSEVEIEKGIEICSFGQNKTLKIENVPYTSDFVISKEKTIAYFDSSKIKYPLVIRRWREGDSFVPFGMKGKKKVSDFLTDRKYSLPDKENTYVLCSEDNIIWIIGERTDNRVKIDKDTKEVIIISYSLI